MLRRFLSKNILHEVRVRIVPVEVGRHRWRRVLLELALSLRCRGANVTIRRLERIVLLNNVPRCKSQSHGLGENQLESIHREVHVVFSHHLVPFQPFQFGILLTRSTPGKVMLRERS